MFCRLYWLGIYEKHTTYNAAWMFEKDYLALVWTAVSSLWRLAVGGAESNYPNRECYELDCIGRLCMANCWAPWIFQDKYQAVDRLDRTEYFSRFLDSGLFMHANFHDTRMSAFLLPICVECNFV